MSNYSPPFLYDQMACQNSPSMLSFVNIAGTDIARYYKRYLMQEALSNFEIGLPEWWDADYTRFTLFGLGFMAVFRTDIFGTIPQHCTLGGQNVFYRPVYACIANPHINAQQLLIGEQCALVKMAPDYGGLLDLVDNYGNMLALAYQTTAVNLLNSHHSFVFDAADKAEADTMKAVFDQYASGMPAVTYRARKARNPDKQPWQPFQQNVGQNFIAPEILDAMRTIRDQFLTDIGIPTIAARKAERVNVDETNKNSVETKCKAELWIDEISKGFKTCEEMFPELEGKLSIRLRYKEVSFNAGENVSDGALSVR